jgi:hypothetical protein
MYVIGRVFEWEKLTYRRCFVLRRGIQDYLGDVLERYSGLYKQIIDRKNGQELQRSLFDKYDVRNPNLDLFRDRTVYNNGNAYSLDFREKKATWEFQSQIAGFYSYYPPDPKLLEKCWYCDKAFQIKQAGHNGPKNFFYKHKKHCNRRKCVEIELWFFGGKSRMPHRGARWNGRFDTPKTPEDRSVYFLSQYLKEQANERRKNDRKDKRRTS